MDIRLLGYFLELSALLTGIYYYNRYKSKETLYLIYFLGFIVLVELVGRYTGLTEEDGILKGLKGTVFEKNYWLFNIQLVVSALFYINYFKWHLRSKPAIKALNLFSWAFLILAILYLIFYGDFFGAFSPFTVIIGTLLIFVSISFYYLELLNSNQILSVYKTVPFYISIGALIFHLCMTPLFIYSVYYKESFDPEFVKLYVQVIFITNFIMYSLYTLGFLICSRNKSPY